MKNEINYNEIDKECVGLVKFFNDNGMQTEFSCEGHSGCERSEFFIIFNGEISDETMYKFICKFPTVLGDFMKWVRAWPDKTMYSNWMYLITNNTPEINHEWAKTDLKTFLREQKND